jgi:hypothetical protein
MATPAQPIVFQVSTCTPCSLPAKILNRGGYSGVPGIRAVVSYATLDVELRLCRWTSRRKERFSGQAAGCSLKPA